MEESKIHRPSFEERAAECQHDLTLSMTVSYNGTPFCGFAKQPGMLTVQGQIEHALGLLFKREVPVVCSGRTDAGVHARCQVLSFDLDFDELRDRTLYSLRRSLNALTHDGITVRGLEQRPRGFSARFDALWREYHYHICIDDTPPVFAGGLSWHVSQPLDVEAMREAAQHLIGEHDFKSFCMAASAVGKPTHRNVHEISLYEETVMGERMLTIKVVGNAFLHSMVRTIVGTLVAVGRGQRKPAWVLDVLAACDRAVAGENAPAQGLVFWHVEYDEALAGKPELAPSEATFGSSAALAPLPTAPAEAEASPAAITTFSKFYESLDGRLCLFEDADGHITAVDSSKLA